MFCDECKKRPAMVHITRVINDNMVELHLCPECANKKLNIQFQMQPPAMMPFANIFATLLPGIMPEFAEPQIQQPMMPEIKCSVCGSGFQDFISSGMLGCSNCYKTFKMPLEGIIRKVHGSTQHIGKVLARRSAPLKLRRDVQELTNKLQTAVKNEEYEKAASLRDKIKELEKQLEQEGEKSDYDRQNTNK